MPAQPSTAWIQKYNPYHEPPLVAPSTSRRILNIHIYMYTCMQVQYVLAPALFPVAYVQTYQVGIERHL
jgi:hypothetical protein